MKGTCWTWGLHCRWAHTRNRAREADPRARELTKDWTPWCTWATLGVDARMALSHFCRDLPGSVLCPGRTDQARSPGLAESRSTVQQGPEPTETLLKTQTRKGSLGEEESNASSFG